MANILTSTVISSFDSQHTEFHNLFYILIGFLNYEKHLVILLRHASDTFTCYDLLVQLFSYQCNNTLGLLL